MIHVRMEKCSLFGDGNEFDGSLGLPYPMGHFEIVLALNPRHPKGGRRMRLESDSCDTGGMQ